MAAYDEPTAVVFRTTLSADTILHTGFSETRGLAKGYEKEEVETFRRRVAETVDRLESRAIEAEAELDVIRGNLPAESYDFPEDQIQAGMKAQLEIEKAYDDFYAWREQAINDVRRELEQLHDDAPPEIDPQRVADSYQARDAWIKKHREQLDYEAAQLLEVLKRIVPSKPPQGQVEVAKSTNSVAKKAVAAPAVPNKTS